MFLTQYHEDAIAYLVKNNSKQIFHPVFCISLCLTEETWWDFGKCFSSIQKSWNKMNSLFHPT